MKNSMVTNNRLNFSELWPRTIQRMKITKSELTGKVLDVGCGDGTPLEYFNYPNHLGIEPSKKRVKICKEKGLNVKQGSIYELKKNVKDKYDTVVCIAMLPHLMDLHLALNNINSVLKDNGKLIISVDNAYSIDRILKKTKYSEEDYHYVCFDETRFNYLLRDNGFKIIKVYHIPNFRLSRLFTFFSKRFCDDMLYIAKKVESKD